MSANRLPWMRLYPGDFLASTAGYTLEATGAAIRLLLAQWERGSLPHDYAELGRICGISVAKFAKLWPQISGRFTPRPEGLIDDALDRVRQKSMAAYEKRCQSAHDTNMKKLRSKLLDLQGGVDQQHGYRDGDRDGYRGESEPESDIRKIQEAERARAADTKPRRARQDGSGSQRIDESDPEVQRRRREAAALLADDSPTEGTA